MRYGSKSTPLTVFTLQKRTMLTRITSHNAMISAKASESLCKPKKSQDQAAFSTSCKINMPRGKIALLNPSCLHTSQAEIAIRRYKTDQTGPKSQLGGFQDGLASAAYHSSTGNREPTYAAPNVTRSATIAPRTDLGVFISTPTPSAKNAPSDDTELSRCDQGGEAAEGAVSCSELLGGLRSP